MAKTPLNHRINRFFYQNRDKGLRNLMIFLSIGNGIVFLLTLLNPSYPFFYNALRFDYGKILQGQIWRLISYPLVYLVESNPIFGIISLLFYCWCGNILDQYWGTLRFNLYYLCGVLFTSLVGMGICAVMHLELGLSIAALLGSAAVGSYYVNLSLLLAVATILPEQEIRIYFVIPVKMKWLAWISVILALVGSIRGIIGLSQLGIRFVSLYLTLLLPLTALANYLLFFGKQSAEILPGFLRYHPKKSSWKRQVKQGRVYDAPRARDNARFRCTVCGRTEISNPGLEFRYCSKCSGYRCYCEDHINNHPHITE